METGLFFTPEGVRIIFQPAVEKSNQVKSEITVFQIIGNYILLGRIGEILYFGFIDFFGRVSKLPGQASLNFHKDDGIFFSDNQIDFLVPGPPVLLDYGVPFTEQIFRRQLFVPPPLFDISFFVRMIQD